MRNLIIVLLLSILVVPHSSYAKISNTDSERIRVIDIQIQGLKSQLKALEKERDTLLGKEVKKEKFEKPLKEVINLKEKFDGSADFSKGVNLASFEIFAKKKKLDGRTFHVTVKGLKYPEVVSLSCPDLIKEGQRKICKVMLKNPNRFDTLEYSITDISIQEAGGSTIYKNEFPAVEGVIKDQ